MADKPEDSSSDQAAEPARHTRKTKPAAIDLPPSAVSEVQGEPPTQPAPQAASPEAPPRKSRMLAPGLVGLVAGIIGGFGAYYLGDYTRQRTASDDPTLATRLGALEKAIAVKPAEAVPSGIVEKITALETKLADAQKRESEMRAALGKLTSEIAGEANERKKAIDALGARPSADAAGAPPNPAEIDALRKDFGALTGKVDAAQPKIDDLARAMEALSGRLAGVAQRDALGAANARMAGVQLIAESMARGRPLAEPLDLLRRLGVEPEKLAAFAPFAQAPVPSPPVLLTELRAIKPAAPPAPKSDQGLLERVKSGAASLVEIRRTGEPVASDDDSLLAQAEQALRRGDIPAALAGIGRLSPERSSHYAAWRGRAGGVAKAGEALDALRADAFSTLAKAAQAK